MQDTYLFQLSLALTPSWQVFSTQFSLAEKCLDFPKGNAFACPEYGTSVKAHDTTEKTWRHLNFFQHNAYLTARVPRVSCQRCGIHQVKVSWARSGSGFTL